MSLDEFVITYFIIGAQITLPIYIYTQIKFGITPAINAVATILIVGSLGISGLGLAVPRMIRMVVRYVRRVTGRASTAGRRRSYRDRRRAQARRRLVARRCRAVRALDVGARRRGRRLAHSQLDRHADVAGRDRRALDPLEQQVDRPLGLEHQRLRHRRQRDPLQARDRDVVEADDRDVGGYSQPDRLARVDQADRADVV